MPRSTHSVNTPDQRGETVPATRALSAPVYADGEVSAGDKQRIDALVKLASDPKQLQSAEAVAARKLLDFDGEVFPSDGCAITLSVLLQNAGIALQDTFMAIDLGRLLERDRHWERIDIGQQQAGDVGSTCGTVPNHGTDHIYLVLRPVNNDEMIVADNQAREPHFRFASGQGGKTPTRYFLRATAS